MPEALPISIPATELSTAVGTVGSAIETPTPATSSATTSSTQLVCERPACGDPGEAERLQRKAGHHDRAPSDPVGERAGDR